MKLFLLNIILLLISIYLFIKTKKKIDNNKEIEKQEQEIKERILKLKTEYLKDIEEKERYTKDLEKWKEILENNKEGFNDALSQYSDILETQYEKKEKEYDDALDVMSYAYNLAQDRLIAETADIQKDLDKIRATRIAAQEALLKEKQIKEQLNFYCLRPSQEDLDDVQSLERIKPKLHQPRILCMLIWSTYFQKPMTTLCNNILGANEVMGIYKITNQETNECYIGQAVDVAKRWKDHVKCGLGIDTPANNKLYKAMQEYGIQNFSFELLEKCKKEELNEKEKYYIELYDSYTYGYNSNTGIKK